ncbi:MAG: copper resistance protein CopC [Thaumarchaeota archaeon]|nr:copper resistance protein CopC [Nitrososphaerota archaeon]
MKNPREKAILAAVLLTFFILITAPSIPPSYAHALMLKSTPYPGQSLSSAPSSVTITFSDPVDIHYTKITVLDSNGKEVDKKDDHYPGKDQSTVTVSLPPSLPNGVYTVSWKTLDQTDGHVTNGGFIFGVGEAVPQKTTAQPTESIYDVISFPFAEARFPSMIGQVIVVGAAFLSLWMWKPIERIAWLRDAMAKTRLQIEKNTAKFVLIGAIILTLGNIAMIFAEAVSINASLTDAMLTKFGQSWIIRMIISSVLISVAFVLYQKQKNSATPLRNTWKWAVFGLGIGVLITDTMISHANATGLALPPLLDFIHDVAASFWIGGLAYGAFAVLPALKKSGDHLVKLSVMSTMIPRFTILIIAILGVVAVTGPTLLYTLENNFSLTLVSIYGEILIVKLSLAAAMIAFGGYHEVATRSKALAKVRLIATEGSGHRVDMDEVRKMESRFHRNIMIESIIGFVLIASVSLLVDSGLPATQYQDQLLQISHASAFAVPENTNAYTETAYGTNGTMVVLTIDPYYSGSNHLRISFFDAQGNLVPMQSARLTYTQVDKGIGPVVENLTPVSQGMFSADTSTFAISGHWNLQIEGVQTAANSLNIIGSYKDLYLAPQIHTISASIKQYPLPANDSRPLMPVYDKIRNTVWISDEAIKTGRIFSFDLATKTFAEHDLKGADVITLMRLNSIDDTLWYLDPISKTLGNYNPDTNNNVLYNVPVRPGSILSGLAIDSGGNVWISVSSFSNASLLLKFDTSKKVFSSIILPKNSQPQGIAIDSNTGTLWVAESGLGKIAEVNPSDDTINEYPTGNGTLQTPTSMLIDPLTGRIYVSEHDGKEISAFDPILKTFTKYPLDQNQQDLPFGMVFDNNHDLWVAQHTLDRIALINTRTGESSEFPVPSTGSLVQHITADSAGDIILVEQGSHAIGLLTTTSGVAAPPTLKGSLPFAYPGIGLGTVAGPSIAVAIVALAFFYTKSAHDMNETEILIRKVGGSVKKSSPI